MNLMKKEISNSLVSKAARDEFNHYKRLLRLSDQLSMSGGRRGGLSDRCPTISFHGQF